MEKISNQLALSVTLLATSLSCVASVPSSYYAPSSCGTKPLASNDIGINFLQEDVVVNTVYLDDGLGSDDLVIQGMPFIDLDMGPGRSNKIESVVQNLLRNASIESRFSGDNSDFTQIAWFVIYNSEGDFKGNFNLHHDRGSDRFFLSISGSPKELGMQDGLYLVSTERQEYIDFLDLVRAKLGEE